LGAQVVKIIADVLHFHSTPSASESGIGGLDPIGAKVAAQANTTNTTMSKYRFIAVLRFSGAHQSAVSFRSSCLMEECRYQGSVSTCLRGHRKMASSNGFNRFVATWPTKPLHGTATGSSGWRDWQSGVETGLSCCRF
jgi:hypothetical protein